MKAQHALLLHVLLLKQDRGNILQLLKKNQYSAGAGKENRSMG
jgi:hypothetical protein